MTPSIILNFHKTIFIIHIIFQFSKFPLALCARKQCGANKATVEVILICCLFSPPHALSLFFPSILFSHLVPKKNVSRGKRIKTTTTKTTRLKFSWDIASIKSSSKSFSCYIFLRVVRANFKIEKYFKLFLTLKKKL